MIFVNNLSMKYQDKEVFKDLNYRFEDTGLYIIKGASGCGKTTFLKILLGLVKPTSGNVSYDNYDFAKLSDEEISSFRFNNIGYVSQEKSALGFKTVDETLKIKNLFNHESKTSNLLKMVGLNNPQQKVITLSGGELRRLELAQALYGDPKILICDEPTNGLDENNIKLILNIISNLAKSILVIMVTHDNVERYIDDYNLLDFNNWNFEAKDKFMNKQIKYINKPINKKIGLWKYNFKTFYHKKIRTLITMIFSVFPLIISGFMINFISSLKESIYQSTSSIFKTDTCVLSSNCENIPYYESIELNDLSDLIDEHNYQYLNYRYEGEFENIFTDANCCYIDNVLVPKMDINNFNDFIYDETILENEIGIYLDYQSYKPFQDYDFTNKELELYLLNEDYSYQESLYFPISFIKQGNANAIASSNLFFNKIIFEDNLGFPIVNNVNEKLSSINTLRRYNRISFSNFEEAYAFEDSLNKDIVVIKNTDDTFSYFYSNNEYIVNNQISKNGLSIIAGSELGYYVNAESGYSGFNGFLYLSNNESTINNLIMSLDGYSVQEHLNVQSSSNVLKGNILNTSENNIKLKPASTFMSSEEIIVSQEIATHLNLKKGDLLYFTYFINESFFSDYLEIIDIIESNGYYIYQNTFWFNRLLRDHFNINGFDNLSTSAVYYFENGYNNQEFNKLKHQTKYEVSNNLYQSVESINSTLDNVVVGTLVVLFIIVVINSLLMILINISISIDSKKEYWQLRVIGLSYKELITMKSYRQISILVISMIESIFVIAFLSKFLMTSITLPITLSGNFISNKTWLFLLAYFVTYLMIILISSIIEIKKKKTPYYL